MLDKSKLKLKSALHGLEISIGRLISQVEELKKENELLKAENKKINSKLSHSDEHLELKKQSLVKSEDSLDMLGSDAVNSIDMSIKELKNMVKKQ